MPSRYGPGVLPTNPLEGIAESIAAVFERGRQKRLLDRQMRMQDEDRATAKAIQAYQLAQQGIHLGNAPESVFANIAATVPDAQKYVSMIGRTPAPDVSATINASMSSPVTRSGKGIAMPRMSTASPALPSSSGTDFLSLFAQAMQPTATTKGPRYEFGNGFYVDREEAANNAARASDAAGQSEFRKALFEYVLPEVVKAQFTPHAPIMGSPEWVKAEADAARARATATRDVNPPPPRAPVMGSPEWLKAETERARAAAQASADVADERQRSQPHAVAARAALPQMQSAMQVLTRYNEPGVASRLFSRSTFGNYTMSREGQLAMQAATQFAQAYLNGRGVRNPAPGQVQEIVHQILVQPGEESNKDLIANKLDRLNQMLQELADIGMVAAQPIGRAPYAAKERGGASANVGVFGDLVPKR